MTRIKLTPRAFAKIFFVIVLCKNWGQSGNIGGPVEPY